VAGVSYALYQVLSLKFILEILQSCTSDKVCADRHCSVCFEAWPEDALEMVANKFLEEVELDDDVRSNTVVMCKHFHESVRLMSELYYAELLRYNYVTPTSYLELILTFKKLLALKRDDIQMLRNRYVTGLEKLDFAASQVPR